MNRLPFLKSQCQISFPEWFKSEIRSNVATTAHSPLCESATERTLFIGLSHDGCSRPELWPATPRLRNRNDDNTMMRIAVRLPGTTLSLNEWHAVCGNSGKVSGASL